MSQLKEKLLYRWDSKVGLLDLFIFAKCDYVIATHSSNFGRLVYEIMHVKEPNPFYRFKSLDSPYFIHGYKSNILSKNFDSGNQ